MAARLSRRRVLAGLAPVAAAGVATGLAGCGFRPLYATPEVADSTALELAAIRIGTIGEGEERRVGQILKNELIDRLTAGVGQRPVRYDLVIELNQHTNALQIQTTDTVTRYNLVLVANCWLYDSATHAVLYQTNAQSTGSYDVVTSEYGTLVAEQETARDAARDLSNSIALLLALYFERSEG